MKKPVSVLLLLLLGSWSYLCAQTHHVYLLSNLESLSARSPQLDAIQDFLQAENNAFTILITGDFVDKNGLGEKPEQDDLDKLDRLLDIAGDKGKMIFIPGDREWDNGGKKALKKVKALEKYLESKEGKGKILLPQKGCMGPEIIDIGDHLRIVALNTQWFLAEHNKPEEEDADCGLLNETEFWFAMEDALGEAENRNVIVAGHHPALSYGQYAGYRLAKKHFLPPVIGSFKTAYHQNIGGDKDLSQWQLRHYSERILKLSERFSGGIFVSGHEYDTQVLYKDESYHINSGAFANGRPVARGKETIYKDSHPGFSKLIFSKNGAVSVEIYHIDNNNQITTEKSIPLFSSPCIPVANRDIPKNLLYNPCVSYENNNTTTISADSFASVTAGPQYEAGLLKKLILGKHYRDAWVQTIPDIPYLNLDSVYGGLTPYAKGGGAQTISLKFESPDGRHFAFRSINKNPTKRMDQDLRPSLYGRITQDKTSHQFPYSSIILGPLMDRLELPHSQPRLYVLPDDPKLGIFQDEFAGMFGTLEMKPKGEEEDRSGFEGADDVESTLQLYKELIDDNDNFVDADKFAKARLLDMWVADWDRHFNNYKWLAYKDGKLTMYTAFPKDRDKSFSLYQGIYKWIEIFHLQKDKTNFRKNYYGLKYLNFKNKTMDRWLLNSYDYDDWMKAVDEFQKTMSDEAIAEAFTHLPETIEPLARKRMMKILQARRDKLPKAIKRYYKMLAKQIDLIGSNSNELFELERLKNGDVHARIFNLTKEGEKGRKLYERRIKRKETEEIRLHGLGKDDHFVITGNSRKSILIRIIGGKGDDVVEDHSSVKSFRKMTRVYDKRDQDKLTLGSEAKKVDTREVLTFESDDFFHYNYLHVLPSLSFNTDDGLGLGLSGTYTRQHFNKPGFGQQYTFEASVTTNQNYNISLTGQYRHVIGRWDGLLGFDLASRNRSFRNFYGYSNNNELDEEKREAGFYRNESSSLNAQAGLRRDFWNKSFFSASMIYDVRKVTFDSPSVYDELPPEDGLGETALIGPQVRFDLDMRDSGQFPTRGLQLKAECFHFLNSEYDYNKSGGRWSSELSTYYTAGVRIPVTLSLKGGFIQTYGKSPFYYKAYLGQQDNLRGFVRNRFGGDEAAYVNSELRFHFGKIITPLVPIKYGIFGLYDTGRTWSAESSSNQWHYAYGGGIYLVPYVERFNLTFTGAWNEENDFLLSFRIGFFVR